MKNKIASYIKSATGWLAALSVLAVVTASFWIVPWVEAQVTAMGGGALCIGTTNGPVVATLTQTITVRPLTITVSGGTNAATVFIGNVMACINGNTNGAFAVGSVTNAVGTGTFSTNIAAFQASVPVTLFLQSVTGTNAVTENAIYGP